MMKYNLPLIILLVILAVYLGLKTLPENGWGGWLKGEGDANTLLSLRYWARDGIIHHKILFLPIGYSKIIEYLDNPKMRHLTSGTVTGGLVGRRLYYTHYPPLYMIPYAWFMKAGFTDRWQIRLFSLLLSFIAFVLFYKFFYLLSKDSLISFFAVLYYAISTTFLDYADSITSLALDDFLKALVLVLSLSLAKNYNLILWPLYFIFSLSSYDFTLFTFVWLFGLEVIKIWKQSSGKIFNEIKTLIKKFFFWASAPVLAFLIQLLQNYWYFGNWQEVMLDMAGAAKAKAYTGNILVHAWNIFYPFYLMTGFKIILAVILVLALFFILRKFKVLNGSTKFLVLLFLSGSAYPFLMVSAGSFSYQGRQAMPLISFLVGSATVFAIRFFRDSSLRQKTNYILCGLLIVSTLILWSGQIYQTVQYVSDWPNNRADDRVIQLSKSLKSLKSGDAAVFYLGDKLPDNFIIEYYLDMPFFSFTKPENLVRDLLWLKNNSKYPFEAIIMADQKQISADLRNLIGEQAGSASETGCYQGEYIFKIK